MFPAENFAKYVESRYAILVKQFRSFPFHGEGRRHEARRAGKLESQASGRLHSP